jgi:hypothetical protein
MAQTRLALSVLLTATLILTAGCESHDQRLADYAQQAMDQQARQNETLARQSQQVAEQSQELARAAHDLVGQDAAARRELIDAQTTLQSQLHEERSSVDTQRQELHVERKSVAAAAIRDPVIAQAILVTGLILAALLPLLVTAYALRRLPDPGPSDTLLAETLIENLDAELRPGLPGPPPALPANSDSPRLGGPDPS